MRTRSMMTKREKEKALLLLAKRNKGGDGASRHVGDSDSRGASNAMTIRTRSRTKRLAVRANVPLGDATAKANNNRSRHSGSILTVASSSSSSSYTEKAATDNDDGSAGSALSSRKAKTNADYSTEVVDGKEHDPMDGDVVDAAGSDEDVELDSTEANDDASTNVDTHLGSSTAGTAAEAQQNKKKKIGDDLQTAAASLAQEKEEEEEEESTTSAAASTNSDHRTKLVTFYTKHNPCKLSIVDKILEKYKGTEDVMFRKLERIYCPPPAAAAEAALGRALANSASGRNKMAAADCSFAYNIHPDRVLGFGASRHPRIGMILKLWAECLYKLGYKNFALSTSALALNRTDPADVILVQFKSYASLERKSWLCQILSTLTMNAGRTIFSSRPMPKI